jgi:histidyl-tRNA synthetase
MINIPKGTKDVLPDQSYKWHYIEGIIRELTRAYNLKEIRTPTFEATELFLRGVGETTDIVNKEMYTFLDKGGRSITLKPEGTAGVARSVIENSLLNTLPLKVYYLTPVFRYERPQSGRLREHHQFGIEIFGSNSPDADAEAILIARRLFELLDINNLELNINSIGCADCRSAYNRALKKYLSGNLDRMCELCNDRFDKNPLRILDCKNEKCVEINSGAPVIQDYLCDECGEHQNALLKILDSLNIPFVINPRIVRGLDYYTRTVFEFVSSNIGAQGTVCGGGRYDNLVEEVGGKPCPAVGFGLGIERLIMVMESSSGNIIKEPRPDIYIAPLGITNLKCISIAEQLRAKGISAETDIMSRNLKAQLKHANRIRARYLIVLGSNELESGRVSLKHMDSGEEKSVDIDKIHEHIGV